MMWEGYGFGMGLGWLIPLAFIAMIVCAVAMRRRNPPRENSPDRALAILKERYARGELTRDEFETMRQDIA